ncbi:MAG: hypothetical protein U1F43_07425 [Myxococcota bacterium]
MDFTTALVNPQEGYDRRRGLMALWRALAAEPTLALAPELEAFVSEHRSYDIEEAAVLGLILDVRARGRGEPVGLGVWARMLPMLLGGLDADLRRGVVEAMAGRSPRGVFDQLYEAIGDDSLGPIDEHYALWATRNVDQDRLPE